MRSIPLLVALCSLVCVAEEPYEVFVDRGETYVRAGTAVGLGLGSMVTVWGDLIASTRERRRAGSATVMEVWPSLARINLDDTARADKSAKKYASFEGKKRSEAAVLSAPPAPPRAGSAGAPPTPALAGRGPLKDPAPPPPAATAGILKGHATYKGAGPWMVLVVWNDETFDWTNCTVSLPGNLVFDLRELKARDHESIALSNFVQKGPERDLTKDSTTVRCTQGASKFMFPLD